MATSTVLTNKPINPRGDDNRPVDSYNRASLYSGKALDFDGVNDQITFGTISDLTFGTGDFSVVLDWQIDSVSTYSWAIAKNPATDLGIGINNTGGLLRLWIGGTLSLGTENILGSDWKKIAVVRESGVVSAYINGVAISLTETAMAGSIDSGDLIVGSWASNADFWNGLLNNVRIFNTALTAAQVSDLYNNPEKIVPTGVADTALKLWLPMMEGAGTTCYDGSGNGNHGTISGATYVNGVGSPVAQTAVIDWNKGVNELQYSEDFSAAAGWSVLTFLSGTLSVTNNYAEAPDGRQTAARIQATHNNTDANSYGILSATATSSTTGNYVGSFWVKSNTGSNQTFSAYVRNNLSGDTHTATSEWTRIELQGSGSSNYLNFGTYKSQGSDASIDILVWGGQINDGTAVTPYTPTIGTTQPNDVLLPQGLTSGRDITGVNLFENVRKQGALNLDGNSWAEVHDNASLDITDAITLEAWVYWDSSSDKGILGRYMTLSGERSYLLYKSNQNNFAIFVSPDGTSGNSDFKPNNTNLSEGWNHLVGVYDGSNLKVYLNGSADGSKSTTIASLYANDEPIEIGRYAGALSQLYTNDIAQPRIYNRALTASEVLNNYNATKDLYI